MIKPKRKTSSAFKKNRVLCSELFILILGASGPEHDKKIIWIVFFIILIYVFFDFYKEMLWKTKVSQVLIEKIASCDWWLKNFNESSIHFERDNFFIWLIKGWTPQASSVLIRIRLYLSVNSSCYYFYRIEEKSDRKGERETFQWLVAVNKIWKNSNLNENIK